MNKTTFSILALLVISGLILSACAATGGSASLAGSSWSLVSYGPVGGQTPAASGIETHVNFGSEGRVSGSVGCNYFSGDYKVKNDSIVFGQIMSTEMACPEPQMMQENTAFQVMTGTARFQVEGDTLTIYAASGDSAITLSKMAE
jgi:heat shock protein HslJ